MLNIGIIGVGFIGSTHLAAWNAARAAGVACRVVAVADPITARRQGDLSQIRGNVGNQKDGASGLAFDPADVRGYATAEELIADPQVNVVSLCTPTPTHVELAIAAMRGGKDVLLEKPVALRSADVERAIRVERETGRTCMPAMCMRFWPAWTWLRSNVLSETFGRVRSATFTRVGERPRWSDTYATGAGTGGALFDLHVHDVDFIRFCFGDPSRVTSTGRISDDGAAYDHVTTFYDFGPDGPPHVVAEGGWDQQRGFPYRMRYVVNFERATADFDITRRPHPLLLCRDDAPGTGAEPVAVDPLLGYDHEVRYFANCVLAGTRPSTASLEDALRLTRVLEAEAQSARQRMPVTVAY